jgi:hypothetical protein
MKNKWESIIKFSHQRRIMNTKTANALYSEFTNTNFIKDW